MDVFGAEHIEDGGIFGFGDEREAVVQKGAVFGVGGSVVSDLLSLVRR